MKHQEFLSLHADQLANLLKSDDLNVVTEENVFESLMTWVQHDSTNREQHLAILLKLIKLPLLSSEVRMVKFFFILHSFAAYTPHNNSYCGKLMSKLGSRPIFQDTRSPNSWE